MSHQSLRLVTVLLHQSCIGHGHPIASGYDVLVPCLHARQMTATLRDQLGATNKDHEAMGSRMI